MVVLTYALKNVNFLYNSRVNKTDINTFSLVPSLPAKMKVLLILAENS